MKELLNLLKNWNNSGEKLALARVIQTWGSSPRPVGSCMLITGHGNMAGSVSGGCVESAVIKESKNVFEDGLSKRLAYGVTDDDAWAVGLTCGGKIQVYLQPWPYDISDKIIGLLLANETFMLSTLLVDGKSLNTIITPDKKMFGNKLPDEVVEKSIEAFNKRNHQTLMREGVEYFIQVFPKRSRIIIIGAAHITADLVSLASHYDFETIVVDPRKTFATQTAFITKPDWIIEKYPSEVLHGLSLDPYTYAVILSHDPKIDDDALEVLLRSDVAYIGALGSKKNHEKRINRLIENGFSMEEIAKIHAPIGVDINAVGAKEIALSIMSAIVKAKNENL